MKQKERKETNQKRKKDLREREREREEEKDMHVKRKACEKYKTKKMCRMTVTYCTETDDVL